LRCAVCKAAITSPQQAIAVNGSHEHAFFNPAGIAFEIRCFRAAPGAAVQGAASDEFTWFPDYRWQVALCLVCQAHLGWRFTGNTTFFGLIASQLR
jgi:hypothetical protein